MDWCSEIVSDFLGSAVTTVLFVPYALFDYDEYTGRVRNRLKQLGYEVNGIHETEDPRLAVQQAQAIYIGGGNTFRLLTALYEHRLLEPIRERVLSGQLPYMGSSAGTNVATCNICTTNDMPIVQPPSFDALSLVPFNVNPHYLDPEPNSTHMGESRSQRIAEYHRQCSSRPPVVGLREGSALLLEGDRLTLVGRKPARVFTADKEAQEFAINSNLTHLLST